METVERFALSPEIAVKKTILEKLEEVIKILKDNYIYFDLVSMNSIQEFNLLLFHCLGYKTKNDFEIFHNKLFENLELYYQKCLEHKISFDICFRKSNNYYEITIKHAKLIQPIQLNIDCQDGDAVKVDFSAAAAVLKLKPNLTFYSLDQISESDTCSWKGRNYAGYFPPQLQKEELFQLIAMVDIRLLPITL